MSAPLPRSAWHAPLSILAAWPCTYPRSNILRRTYAAARPAWPPGIAVLHIAIGPGTCSNQAASYCRATATDSPAPWPEWSASWPLLDARWPDRAQWRRQPNALPDAPIPVAAPG